LRTPGGAFDGPVAGRVMENDKGLGFLKIEDRTYSKIIHRISENPIIEVLND
jgi:hypothetical protein